MLSFLEIIKPLYGVKSLKGYTEKEIYCLKKLYGKLPAVLEEYYHTAGNTKIFHCVQDHWILPEDACLWEDLYNAGYMPLLNENQGCCQACIRLEDLENCNPPVYNTDGNKSFLCSSSLSEFLAAALAYEAAFTFEYCPEDFVYYLEKEDFEIIKQRLVKYPFEIKNWLEIKISLYSNAPSNLVAIMESDYDIQMIYGAANKNDYNKLLKALDGVGEPL